ncbi:MAG: hypothetical protein ABII79_03325 [bacterium]
MSPTNKSGIAGGGLNECALGTRYAELTNRNIVRFYMWSGILSQPPPNVAVTKGFVTT